MLLFYLTTTKLMFYLFKSHEMFFFDLNDYHLNCFNSAHYFFINQSLENFLLLIHIHITLLHFSQFLPYLHQLLCFFLCYYRTSLYQLWEKKISLFFDYYNFDLLILYYKVNLVLNFSEKFNLQYFLLVHLNSKIYLDESVIVKFLLDFNLLIFISNQLTNFFYLLSLSSKFSIIFHQQL